MNKTDEIYYSLRVVTGDGQSSNEKYRTKYLHVAKYWKEQSNWHEYHTIKDSSIWIDSEEEFQKAEFESKRVKALKN